MRRLGGWAIAVLAVLAVAGCGSSKSSTTTSTSTSSASEGASPAIAAQVPATIKAKGTLNVATEAQYAPNEFIAPDGHTIIGMDADLITAIARVMGLKVNLINSNFETIIPGLAAGRYDLGVSSFTDTKEREKVVDFVDYFQAGISFYSKTSVSVGVRKEVRQAARLPRPEPCQPSRRERSRGTRDGGLARGRLPDQSVIRPLQAALQVLWLRSLRHRDP